MLKKEITVILHNFATNEYKIYLEIWLINLLYGLNFSHFYHVNLEASEPRIKYRRG